MKLRALTRFNGHNPGDEWKEDEANAEVWIEEGYAEKAEARKQEKKKKEKKEPPKDKAVKSGEAVTK